jgi:hypothetical protein
MRTAIRISSALILAAGLFAQVRGVGSVVNPAGGAGTPGVTRTVGSVVHPAGGPGSGYVVSPAPGSRGGYGRSSALYAYPVYIGGYYATPYITTPYASDASASAPAQTNVTVVTPPQQPVAPVIINNYYGTLPANPGMAQNQAPPPDEQEPAPTTEPAHYLIALQDHTISIATAYWVDGDTLHYFTAGNVHNQVSLSLVDRAFTERLNKEAGVEVKLPAPSK